MGAVRERSLDRAVQVFECLHEAREPLTVGEIARRLSAPRSTLYDIINCFIKAEILEARESDGAVFFGKSLYLYAIDHLGENDLLRRARNEVDRLAKITHETIEYCTLRGNKYTIVYMKAGAKIIRISSVAGVQIPIPWTASGRLLLAHMDTEKIRALIPKEDFILPDGRVIGFEEFCNDIVEADETGHCVTTGLINSYTRCLAVPIRGRRKDPIATICAVVTVDTPQQRIDELLAALKQSAAFLSSENTG